MVSQLSKPRVADFGTKQKRDNLRSQISRRLNVDAGTIECMSVTVYICQQTTTAFNVFYYYITQENIPFFSLSFSDNWIGLRMIPMFNDQCVAGRSFVLFLKGAMK